LLRDFELHRSSCLLFEAINAMLLDMLAAVARKDYDDRRRSRAILWAARPLAFRTTYCRHLHAIVDAFEGLRLTPSGMSTAKASRRSPIRTNTLPAAHGVRASGLT
jgi:hypothetical protein